MSATPFLSIIIPAYNEEQRIGEILARIGEFVRREAKPTEVIVVDDGSTDNTSHVVREYKHSIHGLRLIHETLNRGKGYAVARGMREARGTYRLFTDADNAVDIGYVYDFLSYIKQGYDIVIASIGIDGATVIEENHWVKRIIGQVAKLLIRKVALPHIYDSQRGFKLFTKEAASMVFSALTIDGYGFDIEVLIHADECGLKVKEVPVRWVNRKGSKVNAASYVRTLGELFLLKWRCFKKRLFKSNDRTFISK